MKPDITLVEQARKLNQAVEDNYIALALVLVDIEATSSYKALGFDDFATYYKQDLGREKSTVSRLLAVGKFLKENGCVNATVSYHKLSEAIKAFPDKEPGFVLAAAQNNTLDELRAEHREAVHGECVEHTPITICTKCHVKIS